MAGTLVHPEDEITEAIYDAFDADDPATALELARRGLAAASSDDPVLRYLAGRALLELDLPQEAADAFLRAVALDADDAEFRAYGAWALFRCCRFDEAEVHARAALAADTRLSEAHHVQGLLLERRGRLAEADAALARAARLDPDRFPPPVRVDRGEFERCLAVARRGLPEDFRRPLDELDVSVDDLPSEALLHESDPPLDPELLGLFSGPPRGERESFFGGGELPPRIQLFKRNLERYSADADDLAEQIRVTLYHELGHYLGLDEDELEDSGFG